jgi:hypothetical protein
MSEVIVSLQYHRRKIDTYHTEECVTVRSLSSQATITEEEALDAGLRECCHCKNEYPGSHNGDHSIYLTAKRIGEERDNVSE